LTATFIKRDFLKLFVYSFLVACLVVILGLSELIVRFNQSEVISKELSKYDQSVLAVSKSECNNEKVASVDDSRLIDITKEDIEVFYNYGYDGKIYELVNVVLDYGTVSTLSHIHKPNNINLKVPYYNGTRGTLVTDEEYVKKIFGDLKYVCTAEEIKHYGIYITDYTADAILTYSKKYFSSYESMLGKHKSMNVSYYAYINGIIDTGYKEKYANIIEKFKSITSNEEELKQFTQSNEYLAYYDDVIENYAISYSFEPDFKEKFVDAIPRTWVPIGNATLTFNGVARSFESNAYFQESAHTKQFKLKDNEIVLDYKNYNLMFNTSYNETNKDQFVPHNVTFKYYQFYDEMQTNSVAEFDVTIVGLSSKLYASTNVFQKLLEVTTFTSSLYFSDLNNKNFNSEVIFSNGYKPNSIIAYSLATMTKAVNVFSDFFNIIFFGLCLCCFIVLVSYGVKLIKEKTYDIGILKALGIKDGHLVFIFGIQILLLLIFVIILYFTGSVLFIDLSNDILVASLLEIAPNQFLLDIDVLYLKLPYMIQNSLLIIIIVIISFIIPFIKLKTLKPTNIIKAKE
jgi:hypothetical protein